MSLVCSQPFSGFPSQIKSHSPQNYLQGPGNFPPVISVIISSPIPFASLFLLVSRVTFNQSGVLLSMINTYSSSPFLKVQPIPETPSLKSFISFLFKYQPLSKALLDHFILNFIPSLSQHSLKHLLLLLSLKHWLQLCECQKLCDRLQKIIVFF